MKKDVEQLEDQLFTLGQLERGIEEKLERLRLKARDAVSIGRLDEADAARSEYEALRPALSPLQSEIMNVERLLYGLRRKSRH